MQKSFVDNIMIQPEQIKYSNHPTGTIQGYYDYIDSFGNKKRISRYGKTKALVFNRFLNDFIVCDDKYNIAHKGNACYKGFAMYWINSVKRYEIKPSSLEILLRTYNSYIDAYLGDVRLNNIERKDLQQVLNCAVKNGYTKSTVKKIKDFFTASFRYAMQEEWLEKNPAEYLTLPRVQTKTENPFLATKNKKIFSKEEIAAIKQTAAIKNYDGKLLYKYGYIFLFMLNTGIRVGEMLALKWKDVDFERNILYIYKTSAYGTNNEDDFINIGSDGKLFHSKKPKFYVQDSPKTRASIRKVFLLPEAIQYLLEYKKYYDSGEEGYIVYPINGDGSQPITGSSFEHRFTVFKRAAGITSGVTIHSLRHTYATNLYYSNVNLKTISASMGHSSTKVTSDVYVNILNDETYDNCFVGIQGINGI